MTPKPFLKWAGGKARLLPELLKRAPSTFGVYHEPFLGGGALFFALRPKLSSLSDANASLIATYRVVRDRAEALIGRLDGLQADAGDEAVYYAQRARRPVGDDETAERTIFLNKTCFNGLWRVNRKGDFNVPFGRRKNPSLYDADNLRACSAALQGASLLAQDFRMVDVAARPGDFVYFDPPYVPLSKSASFTFYAAGGFGPLDQEELRDLALTLKRRGVHVLLSNSGTYSVHKLYAPHFTVDEVRAPRSIAAKAAGRGDVTEFLIR